MFGQSERGSFSVKSVSWRITCPPRDQVRESWSDLEGLDLDLLVLDLALRRVVAVLQPLLLRLSRSGAGVEGAGLSRLRVRV